MGNQHIRFMIDFSQEVKSPKGFSRVDYSIITKNPGKTIYELTELGLTKKGAEALEAIENAKQPTPQPNIVKMPPTQTQVAKPQSVERVAFNQPNRLSLPGQQQKRNDTAKLYNGRTGLTISMSRKAAEKLQSKDSRMYKIVG